MIVLKFGGSSVASPERILKIKDILKDYKDQGKDFCVVFSAFGGVTDQLLLMSKLASNGDITYLDILMEVKARHLDAVDFLIPKENIKYKNQIVENFYALKNILQGVFLVREATKKTSDYIVSFGERNAAFIISATLNHYQIDSVFLDARRVIKTDDGYSKANVDYKLTNELIQAHFKKNKTIQIITGFIGSSKDGKTTTLGRGGSDFTAAIFSNALEAKALEIWTDVNGVLTADPRKVERAFSIPSLTYNEAMEMSHFGAKVIYPPTIQPVLKKEIPLFIKNTFEPEHPGTKISSELGEGSNAVKGISSIDNISFITLEGSGLVGVPGIAARLFSCLAKAKINIILITQGSSEHNIGFAVDPNDTKFALDSINDEFKFELERGTIDPIKYENDLSIIAVIGEKMQFQPGISGKLFNALGKNGINIIAIAQGSSELNISLVISKNDEIKCLNALHETFFLSDIKTLHLFIVGVGLVGKVLMEQMQSQVEFLKERLGIELKIVGLSNSKKMVVDKNIISIKNWETTLYNSNIKSNLKTFVSQMIHLNLRNSIFIDNTASLDPTKFYHQILNNSISISTPNKVGASSKYEIYQQLKATALKRNVTYKFEANVGAGLPVISTINDLINSGDKIEKIEGVLSGSLSYIFNNFNGAIPFLSVLKKAMELGFTEPDPRIDLSGKDVARKILILAREAGNKLNMEDIQINSFLPDNCMKADTVDDFILEVEKEALFFEKLKENAETKGERLRMVATFEDGKATVSLKSFASTHPFYNLSGSDNMIVLTSNRYHHHPLVIQGPGAGAEVTAAGVLAEIISIGKSIY